MRNVTECQERLIKLGYLPRFRADGTTNADGKFGHDSLDAFNHYRASLGKPPIIPKVSMEQLNADLFPEEQPAPGAPRANPISDYLTGLVVKAALNHLKKGQPIMDFLTGYKTYIIGGILIISGGVELLGIVIPGMTGDPGTLIMTGIGMITGRMGAKADVKKAVGL